MSKVPPGEQQNMATVRVEGKDIQFTILQAKGLDVVCPAPVCGSSFLQPRVFCNRIKFITPEMLNASSAQFSKCTGPHISDSSEWQMVLPCFTEFLELMGIHYLEKCSQ